MTCWFYTYEHGWGNTEKDYKAPLKKHAKFYYISCSITVDIVIRLLKNMIICVSCDTDIQVSGRTYNMIGFVKFKNSKID